MPHELNPFRAIFSPIVKKSSDLATCASRRNRISANRLRFRVPFQFQLAWLVFVPLFLLAGCGGATGQSGSSTSTNQPSQSSQSVQFGHVFILVEENASYSSVISNPAMPYLNGLGTQYGIATNYYANAHPS